MADRPAGLSVVVPMRDAADRLAALHLQLVDALRSTSERHEIIYVDDRSTDATWSLIVDLAATEPCVTGLRLDAGAGQVAAIQAGLREAQHALVAVMDDDLEIDPHQLGQLVEAVAAGADLASARRTGRRPLLRAAGSAAFNARLRSWGYPFRDVGCAFMVMRAEVATDLAAQGQAIRNHRFKPAVVRRGFRVVEVPVPSRPTGPSHFTLGRLVASWFDVEASERPTTLLGLVWIGLAVVLGAAAVGVAATVRAEVVVGLLAVVLLVLGIALVGLGLAANHLIRALVQLERGEAEVTDRTGRRDGAETDT